MVIRPIGRLAREPLVHFLAAGVVLFALHAAVSGPPAPAPETITLTAAEQRNIAALFEKTWQRPPTEAERAGLIEARIREEVLYREALAMGLEEDDVVVRRRLVQKLEFITEDMTAREPTDAELATFLEENGERYTTDISISLRQVFLDTDERGAALTDDAARLIEVLEGGADPGALGDPTLLPQSVELAPLSHIAGLFGSEFADAVATAESGVWHGPVRSAYGAHLVLIEARREGRRLGLADARPMIERDWREARRKAAEEDLYQALRAQYRIEIEAPDSGV